MTSQTAPMLPPSVQTFLASLQGWPHWLNPSPQTNPGTAHRAMTAHLSRLADAAGFAMGFTGATRTGVVELPPLTAARLAGAHAGWRQALARSAALALDTAARTGRRGSAAAAAITAAGLARRQVWSVAAARWVGCWVAQRTGGADGAATLTLQPSLWADPRGAQPALAAARHAAYHHALHALWLAAVDSRGQGSPAGPLVQLWRWGYWPLGPGGDGRFLVARVTGLPQQQRTGVQGALAPRGPTM